MRAATRPFLPARVLLPSYVSAARCFSSTRTIGSRVLLEDAGESVVPIGRVRVHRRLARGGARDGPDRPGERVAGLDRYRERRRGCFFHRRLRAQVCLARVRVHAGAVPLLSVARPRPDHARGGRLFTLAAKPLVAVGVQRPDRGETRAGVEPQRADATPGRDPRRDASVRGIGDAAGRRHLPRLRRRRHAALRRALRAVQRPRRSRSRSVRGPIRGALADRPGLSQPRRRLRRDAPRVGRPAVLLRLDRGEPPDALRGGVPGRVARRLAQRHGRGAAAR